MSNEDADDHAASFHALVLERFIPELPHTVWDPLNPLGSAKPRKIEGELCVTFPHFNDETATSKIARHVSHSKNLPVLYSGIVSVPPGKKWGNKPVAGAGGWWPWGFTFPSHPQLKQCITGLAHCEPAWVDESHNTVYTNFDLCYGSDGKWDGQIVIVSCWPDEISQTECSQRGVKLQLVREYQGKLDSLREIDGTDQTNGNEIEQSHIEAETSISHVMNGNQAEPSDAQTSATEHNPPKPRSRHTSPSHHIAISDRTVSLPSTPVVTGVNFKRSASTALSSSAGAGPKRPRPSSQATERIAERKNRSHVVSLVQRIKTTLKTPGVITEVLARLNDDITELSSSMAALVSVDTSAVTAARQERNRLDEALDKIHAALYHMPYATVPSTQTASGANKAESCLGMIDFLGRSLTDIEQTKRDLIRERRETQALREDLSMANQLREGMKAILAKLGDDDGVDEMTNEEILVEIESRCVSDGGGLEGEARKEVDHRDA
ncbi:hypothetical protein IAU60_006903 [Kwoniella sp. DSM 27419]